MAYTTIKKPSDYFNTKLYTGNGASSKLLQELDFNQIHLHGINLEVHIQRPSISRCCKRCN
jgi:hypothetical protein